MGCYFIFTFNLVTSCRRMNFFPVATSCFQPEERRRFASCGPAAGRIIKIMKLPRRNQQLGQKNCEAAAAPICCCGEYAASGAPFCTKMPARSKFQLFTVPRNESRCQTREIYSRNSCFAFRLSAQVCARNYSCELLSVQAKRFRDAQTCEEIERRTRE